MTQRRGNYDDFRGRRRRRRASLIVVIDVCVSSPVRPVEWMVSNGPALTKGDRRTLPRIMSDLLPALRGPAAQTAGHQCIQNALMTTSPPFPRQHKTETPNGNKVKTAVCCLFYRDTVNSVCVVFFSAARTFLLEILHSTFSGLLSLFSGA